MKKTGILLINLGTPDAATAPAVRRYLREFLSDPYVIDIPALPRWILLHAVILPFRTKQTTAAYQQIWTEQGSPLLTNSQALTEKIHEQLKETYTVALGMRYGQPSIQSAVDRLLSDDLEKIIIMPLYPQYADSTTKSSLQYAKKIISQKNDTIAIKTIDDFYDNSNYLDAKAGLIKTTLKNTDFEKLIFSYHGLPERHIQRVCHEKIDCDLKKPCPSMGSSNTQCYRAQCYTTSNHLAKKIGLATSDYLVTFQSRLGKTPWITPYTDLSLNELAQQGIKNIAVVCPSFVADCLETLEEIDIRAKAQWQELGGNKFIRIPCLNDNTTWVNALASILLSQG